MTAWISSCYSVRFRCRHRYSHFDCQQWCWVEGIRSLHSHRIVDICSHLTLMYPIWDWSQRQLEWDSDQSNLVEPSEVRRILWVKWIQASIAQIESTFGRTTRWTSVCTNLSRIASAITRASVTSSVMVDLLLAIHSSPFHLSLFDGFVFVASFIYLF